MKTLLLGGVEYSRRGRLEVIYEGKDITKDIKDSIIDCNYRDSINEFDTIDLTLEDRKNLWIGDWFPKKGDKLEIKYVLNDWDSKGIKEHLLGIFFIDNIDYSGPPSTVNLRGISVDIVSNIMDGKEYKAWEQVTIKKIAEDIAKKCDIELICDFKFNRVYNRVEQKLESDYTLLKRLCREAGITVKLYSNKLILFEEAEYEKNDPVINLTKSDCLDYRFSIDDTDTYSGCRISYYDYVLDKKIEHTFNTKQRPGYKKNTQRILFINEDVAPKGETKEEKKEYLLKIAQKELREKNKLGTTGSFNLKGLEKQLSAGDIIKISSFGRFDGNYIITEISTNFAEYQHSIAMRKCLEGY